MSCDGDQHTMQSSDDVLPPPGDIQVLLLTLDSVSLSWSSPQGLTGPQTFRVTWGCDGETSSTRVKDVYHLKISSLRPGEKYQFNVATEGEDGRQSRWVSASISTVVTPRDLKVDHLEETSFTLHWSKAEGMEKVPQRFFISNCIPGTDPLTAVTDDCHKNFSNLHPGTEYTVSVATVLSNGEQSEPVSSTICTILPAPDQLTVDSVDTTSAAVSWSQPPGLDHTQHHYKISYCCPGIKPHITTTSSPSITLCDLKPATEYSVTVCTVLENGKQSQLVLTTFTTVPTAPGQLTVDTTSATVSWSQSPGLDQTQHHYQISYRCPGTEPHYTTTSSHSITLSDLKPATEYSVTVCTVLENGKKSRLVSTTLTTILPAPDQLTVDSVDTTSATVSWSQPPGLDQTQHHYQISYRCPGTEPHITTTSSHSITLCDLQCGTQYSVTVCTVLENGKQSRLVSTTLTTILPAPDQLTVDSVDTTSAAVSWSQPPGLNQTQHHYHYQISYQCPGTKPHITITSSHSISLSDLQCGTQYSVTVCTVLENGKQSQLVSTTLTTEHFQWWKRPSTVAAVFVVLAVIMGLWDSYAAAERDQLQTIYNTLTKERDQLQNSLNTRTTERDQLQNSLNTRTTDRDQLQNSLNTRTTERDQLQNSLNTRTTERDQLQNSLNTRTTEIDELMKSLNTTTMERDQLQKEKEWLNWKINGKDSPPTQFR
ncbi:fibronectin isoform X1 [Oncorhynchus kisutch]|uniref:fibronectin isoform X1 n=1 Tax=Oncorhynchus kisutch TaxID=8019 RepID=UPI0012DF50A5|nr:fibronectin-like isoform X1 [Oncorhynchus kisutch]